MKNINKTTKTILFASLIAAMILPFSGMMMAEAAPNENVNNTAKDNVPDKIPKDKILKRDGNKWIQKYKNEDDFNIKQKAIEAYTNANLPQNGWNQAMQEDSIIIHNLETIIKKIGNGYELVGLFAEKDRLLNTYDASEPLTKFHDWTIMKYNVPSSVEEIDEKIVSIVSKKYSHLVPEYISAFNNMAEHGSVPDELRDLDSDYWIMVANVSLCGYVSECDKSFMQNVLDNGLYGSQETVIPTFNIIDSILPKAYAITYVLSYGFQQVHPYDCEYSSSCIESDISTGTSPHTINQFKSQDDEHSFGNSIDVYASTCAAVGGATAKVTGNVEAKTQNFGLWAQAANCAITDREIQLGGNPTAPWFWDVDTTHKAWT